MPSKKSYPLHDFLCQKFGDKDITESLELQHHHLGLQQQRQKKKKKVATMGHGYVCKGLNSEQPPQHAQVLLQSFASYLQQKGQQLHHTNLLLHNCMEIFFSQIMSVPCKARK
jgi:hypothetical protein